MIEYLGEIEAEFENTSACLSGAQMGLNHEKNWRSKISWHTPFKKIFSLKYFSSKKSFVAAVNITITPFLLQGNVAYLFTI